MSERIKALQPFLLTCVFAGLVLAILAPLGTANFSFAGRVTFWIGLCFVGGFGAATANALINKANWQPHPLLRAFIQSLLASIAVAIVLTLLNIKTYGSVSLTQFFVTLFYIWVVAMTISAIGVLTHQGDETDSTGNPTPALVDRLPMHLKSAQIYALSAEDHYVRVITSNGDEMVLMRLSDAIKEVSPLSGLSPHRSWWVAESGVEKLGKENGKQIISLKSGQNVPISRNGQKTVREAGWR